MAKATTIIAKIYAILTMLAGFFGTIGSLIGIAMKGRIADYLTNFSPKAVEWWNTWGGKALGIALIFFIVVFIFGICTWKALQEVPE